jgi:hypothetical protein
VTDLLFPNLRICDEEEEEKEEGGVALSRMREKERER